MCDKAATERRELYKACPDFHNYMDTVQKNQVVTVHHRCTVFEWNLKLADNELRLSDQALHYAFAYFDRYLSRTPCPREQLGLVSTAAMWIASKICSTECPVAKVDDLAEIVGIRREEIKRMECWMVRQRAATIRALCTTCIYSRPCKLGIAGSEFCPLALRS